MEKTKNKLTINLDESFSCYIESLLYDKMALSEMLSRLASYPNVDKDIYDDYNKKYMEKNREYCIAKNELFNNIIKPYMNNKFGEKVVYNWEVDFYRNEVEVSYETID